MTKIKRKKGYVYQARILLPNGKFETKVFDRKVDAQEWKAQKKRQIRMGDLDCSKLQPKMLVSDLASLWFNRKILNHKSEKTVIAYRGSIKNYILPILGDCPLMSFDESVADDFKNKLVLKGLKPKTMNRHIMVLKCIAKFALREGFVGKNPLEFVDYIPEADSDFTFLEETEVLALMDSLVSDKHTYTLYMLALNTGMRVGEICGLEWDHVYFSRKLIHVKQSLSHNGKIKATKTKRHRFVPMNQMLFSFLSDLQGNPLHPRFVSIGPKGNTWNTDHLCQRVHHKALTKAGVQKVKFHDLRHTYASHFVMNGGSVFDLQKILGHTKVEMTMKYAHLSPEYLVHASNVVSFSGKLPESNHKNLRRIK
jgi:integrase